jgi:hypothetical protein
MVLGSWNYRWENNTFHTYGIAAQEFFSAFGQNVVSSVGDDSTLTPADVAGITLIGIQALEKRTELLREKLAARDEQILELKRDLSEMRSVAFRFEEKLQLLYRAQVVFLTRLKTLESSEEQTLGAKPTSSHQPLLHENP